MALGVGGAVLIVLAWLLVAPQLGSREPTPASLARDFARHRNALERLSRMLAEDEALLEVGRNYTRPQDVATVGVSAQRLRDYRALMREAGVQSLSRNYEFAQARPAVFEVWGKGALGRKWGYMHALGEPYGAVVADLTARPRTTGLAPVFEPLEEHWFLYYLCAAGCE
jgi:hypothetical protein